LALTFAVAMLNFKRETNWNFD